MRLNHHPLRCRCGSFQGQLKLPATTGRALCYCKDCQTYAHFLGRASDILDAAGGTDIVATLPSNVAFTQGVDQVVCMSLSDRGPLRWYAACCATPIGNTPRSPKIPYVGLVHRCLSMQPLERSFGPVRMRIHTGSARGKVGSTPAASVAGVFKLGGSMLLARLRGRHRDNPFFDAASGAPIKPPRVLAAAERAVLRKAAAS